MRCYTWYHENKDYARAKQLERVARNLRIMDDAKRGKPCVDCGQEFPLPAMHLDHVRGEKVKSVARMRTASVKNLLAEIDKCEVRCANCHAIRTWAHRPRYTRIEVPL